MRALPRGLPHGGVSLAGGGGRPPLPLLSINREQGSRSRAPPARLRGPRVWLRHLPGHLPLEQFGDSGRRPPLRAARAVGALARGDGRPHRARVEGAVGGNGRGPRPVRRLSSQRAPRRRRPARPLRTRGDATTVRRPEPGGRRRRPLGAGPSGGASDIDGIADALTETFGGTRAFAGIVPNGYAPGRSTAIPQQDGTPPKAPTLTTARPARGRST